MQFHKIETDFKTFVDRPMKDDPSRNEIFQKNYEI